jgi:hypothetical protein
MAGTILRAGDRVHRHTDLAQPGGVIECCHWWLRAVATLIAAAGATAALVALVVTVMAATVVRAPVAGADSGYDFTDYGYKGDHDANAYAMQLHGVKLSGTVQDAADLAASMCSKFDQGASGSDLITAAQLLNGLQSVQAATVVWDAAWHFCPSHYH